MTTEEQRKEKEPIDTRSFPEIYASLNQLQQIELRDEIIRRLGISRQAVFAWTKGKAIPQYTGARKIVSDCIKKVTGIYAPQHLLFDIKRKLKHNDL